MKLLASNRRVRFEYEILERITAGIALTGSEVKSIRDGHAKLMEGWVAFEGGEAFLVDVNIAPYENAGYANHDPTRRRKLLMAKRDIIRLASKVAEKGLSVVPLAIGAEGNWIKVEIALARGKKLHDKRDSIKSRDVEREIKRFLK